MSLCHTRCRNNANRSFTIPRLSYVFHILLTAQLSVSSGGQLQEACPQEGSTNEDMELLQIYENVITRRAKDHAQKHNVIERRVAAVPQIDVAATVNDPDALPYNAKNNISELLPEDVLHGDRSTPGKASALLSLATSALHSTVATAENILPASQPFGLMAVGPKRQQSTAVHFGFIIMVVLIVVAVGACVYDLRSDAKVLTDKVSNGNVARQNSTSEYRRPSMPRTATPRTTTPFGTSTQVGSEKNSQMSLLPRSATRSQAQRFALAVPSLLEAPLDELQTCDFKITDLTGMTLLTVTVMVPPKPLMGTDQTPLEYVTVYSKDGQDELAMCALGPQGLGKPWRCDVYQKGDQIVGHLVRDQHTAAVESFSLIDARRERFLYIVMEYDTGQSGSGKQRRTSVFGRNEVKCAEVQPGVVSFGSREQYYHVDCLPEADVGIVVIALLAVDRLRTHSHLSAKLGR